MEFWKKFVEFLTDEIPNTPIPYWVALLAFVVIVIILAIIISVCTGKASKKKATKLAANIDSVLPANVELNNNYPDVNEITASEEHIINIDREVQLNATNTVSHATAIATVNGTPQSSVITAPDKSAPITAIKINATSPETAITSPVSAEPKPTAIAVSDPISTVKKIEYSQPDIRISTPSVIPIIHIISTPDAPIAKPVLLDGKTEYTKGVSGKVLPQSSIAKPLVSHANEESVFRAPIAQPIKPTAKVNSVPLSNSSNVVASTVNVGSSDTTTTNMKTSLAAQSSATANKSTITPTVSTVTKAATAKDIATTPKKAAPPKSAVAKDNATSAATKSVKPAGKDTKIIKSLSDDGDTNTFGKYVIAVNKTNIMRPYSFELRANNGQLLFESEPYKVKPRINSITAFRNYTKDGSFIIDEDKQGYFRYKLYNTKGELMGVGESYKTRQACENSIESTKSFADRANVIEDNTDAKS